MSQSVCFVTCNTFTTNAFLAGPIRTLAEDDWAVTVVCNTVDGQVDQGVHQVARVLSMDLARQIAPWQDLRVLWQLWRLFRRERFDVVHSITPKAGLLAMLAAWAARIPARHHTFTGQVWATRRGPMRWLLRSLDQIFAAAATEVLADSPSQRDFMAGEHVAPLQRIRVLGDGSICGVDTHRFRPDPVQRALVRQELGVAADAVILLYLGRLHPEKGVQELGVAFGDLATVHPNVHLVLVGPDEGALPAVRTACQQAASRLHVVGMSRTPERYMAAADVFCLPSFREGFGLSLLEAAAVGVPCVATRIYGITDAVEDGRTGLLVPPHDAGALREAIERLVLAPSLRSTLGQRARERAAARFSRERMLGAWRDFYRGTSGTGARR
jgi:glycosyltransferase involved in cell wall biosynthesis